MDSFVVLIRLYVEELKALPRGRFALPGMALLALVLLVMAVVIAPSPLGLWSFALIVYGSGPVLVGTFVSLRVADLRASRFVHSLYTSPIESWQVLTTHLLVGLTLSAGYLVVTMPFLGVAAFHVEVPASVLRLALGGALLMTFAVILGAAMAVLLPARSVSAPVALTAGFLVLSMLAIPPAALLQGEDGGGDAFLMRALHVSPYVLASDALGMLEPSTGVEAREPGKAGVILVLEMLAILALALWSYTREQGPEGWENRRSRRGLLAALAVVLLVVAPLATAAHSYATIEGHVPLGRGFQSYSHNATIVLVMPGEPVEAAPMGQSFGGSGKPPLAAGRTNPRDLLILLPVAANESVRDLHATLETDSRLAVEPSVITLERIVERTRIGREGSPESSVLALRVPVDLTPRDPQDLTSNYHHLWFNVTYHVEGEADVREGTALAAIRADVPWVLVQMALSGAPLVLVVSTAAIHRHIRIGSTR